MKKLEKLENLKKALASSKGTFFSVEFVRRTDSKRTNAKKGDIEKLTLRVGETASLKGGNLKYDRDEKMLIGGFSTSHGHWVNIPVDSMTKITIQGITYSY